MPAAEVENVPAPLVLVVIVITGIYFLGRWEGWWVYLANKFGKKEVLEKIKVLEVPEVTTHTAWCGNYQCSGDCWNKEER